MPDAPSNPSPAQVAITLNAVFAAIESTRPLALCVNSKAGLGLPYGPFDPSRHRTFEIGVREWVEKQTHMSLGYVEQLYTFGDKGRESPEAALANSDVGERIVSVGYLALAPEPAPVSAAGAGWRSWYSFFPWEDWRAGEPAILSQTIIPALEMWAASGRDRDDRNARIAAAFGSLASEWDEARVLDRYELMYEAGLVAEARRDRTTRDEQNEAAELAQAGTPMISDHRRILATAIGRLRGKLRYRPIIFELAAPEFTLLELQMIAEAILGFTVHKQNFRRSVEKSGLVERTDRVVQQLSGRPAAVFAVSREGLRANAAAGLTLPRLKRTPSDD